MSDDQQVWYRNQETGELAYLVSRADGDYLKLNRPNEPEFMALKFDEKVRDKWKPEMDRKPFTHLQIAQVAFEADKMLCQLEGHYQLARRNWVNMSGDMRHSWSETGPKGSPARKKLFRNIMECLKGYCA